MSCPVCGAWSSMDPDTGYDGPDICPSCGAEGWVEALIDGHVEIVNERDEIIVVDEVVR